MWLPWLGEKNDIPMVDYICSVNINAHLQLCIHISYIYIKYCTVDAASSLLNLFLLI